MVVMVIMVVMVVMVAWWSRLVTYVVVCEYLLIVPGILVSLYPM